MLKGNEFRREGGETRRKSQRDREEYDSNPRGSESRQQAGHGLDVPRKRSGRRMPGSVVIRVRGAVLAGLLSLAPGLVLAQATGTTTATCAGR